MYTFFLAEFVLEVICKGKFGMIGKYSPSPHLSAFIYIFRNPKSENTPSVSSKFDFVYLRTEKHV